MSQRLGSLESSVRTAKKGVTGCQCNINCCLTYEKTRMRHYRFLLIIDPLLIFIFPTSSDVDHMLLLFLHQKHPQRLPQCPPLLSVQNYVPVSWEAPASVHDFTVCRSRSYRTFKLDWASSKMWGFFCLNLALNDDWVYTV